MKQQLSLLELCSLDLDPTTESNLLHASLTEQIPSFYLSYGHPKKLACQ